MIGEADIIYTKEIIENGVKIFFFINNVFQIKR